MGVVALGIVWVFTAQQAPASFAGTLSAGLILFSLLGISGGAMLATSWQRSFGWKAASWRDTSGQLTEQGS